MPRHELAQLNIATLIAPIDSPTLADFVARLDEINALAESAPGFVWRFKEESSTCGPGALPPFREDQIVNFSVWTSPQALHDYVYRTAHAEVMARRREWFSRMRDAYTVLWWIPAGHRPTPAEAHERLERLRADGPTAEAFTFKRPFPAPGTTSSGAALGDGNTGDEFVDLCPAS